MPRLRPAAPAKNLAAWLWIGILLSVIFLLPSLSQCPDMAGAVLAVTVQSAEG
jgi:hypothetical protein